MSGFSAKLRSSAGSTTLPVCALIGGTGALLRIYEIAVYNTTTTAVTLQLCRLSGAGAGTPGTAATSRLLNGADTATAVGALRNTYTGTAPTVITDLGILFGLGAAINSAVILPFADYELVVPAVANAGIGLIVDSGTGQPCDIHYRWKE